jgi:hypothetical protein
VSLLRVSVVAIDDDCPILTLSGVVAVHVLFVLVFEGLQFFALLLSLGGRIDFDL